MNLTGCLAPILLRSPLRSPLRVGANIHALPKLTPSSTCGLGAWCRNDSRFPPFGLTCSSCGACAVVVVAALLSSLLPRRHRCSLDVAAPAAAPIAAPGAAAVADPVAASPLRVPWTFGILGSLRMPFRRGDT